MADKRNHATVHVNTTMTDATKKEHITGRGTRKKEQGILLRYGKKKTGGKEKSRPRLFVFEKQPTQRHQRRSLGAGIFGKKGTSQAREIFTDLLRNERGKNRGETP